MSTLLALPDDRRAAVERELASVARAAALGQLAADVAHDVANPLFGVIGLADLLRDDAPAGSDERMRLEMLHRSMLDISETLQGLLDFARLGDQDAGRTPLQRAAGQAVRLLHHGARKLTTVDERYPDEPVTVPCPPSELVQAILQLLLAVPAGRTIVVEIDGPSLRVVPAPRESLGTVVAARIVTDRGATVERDDDSLTLRWTG